MTVLSRDMLLPLLAEAQLAPSVHNVQPARWRIEADGLTLLGDTRRMVPVADPAGRDWRLSLGASLEGLVLAATRHGLRIEGLSVEDAPAGGQPAKDGKADPLVAVARMTLVAGHAAAGHAEGLPLSVVTGRATWRGAFRDLDTAANEAVARLAAACPECIVIAERPSIAAIAALFDEASMHFLRQSEHRAELLRWMRLSRRHPDYALDGLNAEAMAMSGIEARAAGLVLGPLFRPLDALGLAARLSSEAGKTKSAAAIVLLHRPQDEDPFETGRQFYRAWLGFERAGLKACPMSVLADWDLSRARLAQAHGVPEGRRIVGVFRIGVPQGAPQIRRFRLPVESLLV